MSGVPFDIVACGDDALRILSGEGGIRHELSSRLIEAGGWEEIVPGRRDVTVRYDPYTESMDAARSRVASVIGSIDATFEATGPTHQLQAVFGGEAGPDLALIAARLGLTQQEVVSRVSNSPLMVDMLGFTPGFAYLTGLDPALQASRLEHPRARVPAGSIGLISGQIGLYALDGPGGWPLIGRVTAPLFDKTREHPFLLAAGDSVFLEETSPL